MSGVKETFESRFFFHFFFSALFFCDLLRPPEWVFFPLEPISRSGVLRMLFSGLPFGRYTLLLGVVVVLLGCGAIGVPSG